jgi:hypothetical protein
MSDLSDLHGIYPTSLRWNAESGFLAVSAFNGETGERELQQIEFGQAATFVVDFATRERGYGLIKSGVHDMKLTPVGSPPPPWPDNDEYKPALGCWAWNPTFREVRLETNAALFREAIANVWDKCRFEPQAAEGLQPVICFADRVSKLVKQVGKTFYAPVIRLVGWVERDRVPGWSARTPTVLPPAAPLILPAPSVPAPSTAFAGELTAAMVIAAMQTLVVNLIASSPPSDLDPPILRLSDTGIGGDGQFGFALGQDLEPVGRNAANDEASEHRRGAALG